MSEPNLTPALTPEEWAAVKAGELVLDNARFHSVPAIMAIANATLSDGDPRKLMWGDVEACLAVARHWEGIADNSHEWGHREIQYEWERRAAKFAALLPPHADGGLG